MTDKEATDDQPSAATPTDELERQIMSPSVAKNEREWWASRRIEALTAESERKDAALQAYLDAFDQATGTVYVEPIIRKALEKQP